MAPKKKRKERHTVDKALREDYALRALRGPKGAQAEIAEEVGVSPGAVSSWVVSYRQKYPRWHVGESHETAKLKTQSSRPAAPPTTTTGARPLEVVSREYGEAVARVKALKAEMRALLGDD